MTRKNLYLFHADMGFVLFFFTFSIIGWLNPQS